MPRLLATASQEPDITFLEMDEEVEEEENEGWDFYKVQGKVRRL